MRASYSHLVNIFLVAERRNASYLWSCKKSYMMKKKDGNKTSLLVIFPENPHKIDKIGAERQILITCKIRFSTMKSIKWAGLQFMFSLQVIVDIAQSINLFEYCEIRCADHSFMCHANQICIFDRVPPTQLLSMCSQIQWSFACARLQRLIAKSELLYICVVI